MIASAARTVGAAVIAAGAAVLPRPALAADTAAAKDTELDAVIVTAPGESSTVWRSTHGVSAITAEDIRRSTALTLGELLAREANVNLQSFFGNDRSSTVDIRGMGATANSNVLVLVDGVRLNANDLSGADLSSIPLSQIERIDIVRGGGAVRFGNGAVAGVINIITKRGSPGAASANAYASYGSYDTTDLQAGGSAGAGPFVGSLNVSGYNTNGYRQNGYVDARDVQGELRWLPTGKLDFLEVFVRGAWHHDESGLPGPVSAAAFNGTSAERRASRAPNDRSETTDWRTALGANLDFESYGRLELLGTYRDRENPYFLGYNPAVAEANQRSQIDATQGNFTARYELPFDAFGYRHSVVAGYDAMNADYSRQENGQNVLDNSTRRTGTANDRAFYAAATLRAPADLSFNAGIRFDRFETSSTDERYTRAGCTTVFDTVFVDILPGPGVILIPIRVPRVSGCTDAYRVQGTQGGTWNNRGVEIGALWQPTPELGLFASWTQNFRNPNVDELLLAAADLRPQTGETYEAGARYRLGDRLALGATVFYMRVDDEIGFSRDPRTGQGVNRNFESRTRRIGTEIDARWKILDPLALRLAYGYVDATFESTGANVPLVPSTTATAELQWSPRQWFQWAFSGRYVSSRYDGNDFTNTQFPQLPSYTVYDTALRFLHRNYQLSLGINNLFNEVYSTIAYSGTYYPMPERFLYAALRASF